jgi:HK97 family phage major capsid protein
MTPDEIKLQEESNKLLMDIRSKYETLEKGRITKGDFDEFKSKADKMFGEIDLKLAELSRPKLAPTKDEEKDLETKSFNAFIRKGERGLTPEEKQNVYVPGQNGSVLERKALLIGSGTGGVLCPPEYVQQIFHYASVMHPVRQIATVRQTDRFEVEFPVNDAGIIATWVAEGGTKSETTAPTYALTTVIPQKIQVLIKATQEWLDDTPFNAEAEIAYQAGIAFGALEGTAFWGGNGTTTGPEGMSTNATVLADHRDLGTDNTLAFDDFIKTQYQLESPYAANGAWVMNRVTLGTVMTLKNATTNAYLVQPNLQLGQPNGILGWPVYEWSDVPSQSSTTIPDGALASSIVTMCGDFRRGYTVVDRRGMTVQRLNEVYATTGYIGFMFTARVGGGVIIPPALQILKNIT